MFAGARAVCQRGRDARARHGRVRMRRRLAAVASLLLAAVVLVVVVVLAFEGDPGRLAAVAGVVVAVLIAGRAIFWRGRLRIGGLVVAATLIAGSAVVIAVDGRVLEAVVLVGL